MRANVFGPQRAPWTLGIVFLSLLLVLAGPMACSKKAAEEGAQAVDEKATTVHVGLNVFEGKVSTAYGHFLYVPEIVGFDIVAAGSLEGIDFTGLEGKDIRIEGEFNPDKPSVLFATRIDVKEGNQFQTFYTKAEGAETPAYLDQRDRANFAPLTVSSPSRNSEWEGKTQVKVLGRLEKQTEGSSEISRIVISDDKGRLVGKIIIDDISDFALYYIKKLRLFDEFWFYINVKETVDGRTRSRTRDLFHSDVVFTGLY